MNKIINYSNYSLFESTLVLLSFKYKYHRIQKGNLITCVNRGSNNTKVCYL